MTSVAYAQDILDGDKPAGTITVTFMRPNDVNRPFQYDRNVLGALEAVTFDHDLERRTTPGTRGFTVDMSDGALQPGILKNTLVRAFPESDVTFREIPAPSNFGSTHAITVRLK